MTRTAPAVCQSRSAEQSRCEVLSSAPRPFRMTKRLCCTTMIPGLSKSNWADRCREKITDHSPCSHLQRSTLFWRAIRVALTHNQNACIHLVLILKAKSAPPFGRYIYGSQARNMLPHLALPHRQCVLQQLRLRTAARHFQHRLIASCLLDAVLQQNKVAAGAAAAGEAEAALWTFSKHLRAALHVGASRAKAKGQRSQPREQHKRSLTITVQCTHQNCRW